jgi:cysteinyl-tRNA synthetase
LGRVVPFEPRDPGKVSMYVCGPTVYDVPHLGHGRFSLVFDVLRRYLEWRGFDVRYVSNVTDIDDNIIKRANEEGRSTDEVVEEYERAWWDAMDALGVKRPTVTPHATGYVEQMVALVQDLVDRDMAYETRDGVYFEPSTVADYGLLARQSIESLRAGARVGVDEEKRAPIDFALWKKAKPGEPAWPSPWGPGRPGWHTECVVMSLDLLGDGFDVHGGGQDLAFPHHENERAQAVAVGRGFARHWVHNGWVVVDGEKMSKSLGNFSTLTDLLARADARAYRLLVLRAHYRSPVEVTPDTVAQAEATLAGLDNFARAAAKVATTPPAEPDAAVLAQFTERMDDDLNTPGSMELLFTAVTRFNSSHDPTLAAAIHEMARAVGLELHAGTGEIDAASAELVRQRDLARAEKDYARADALRAELQARGWTVEDGPEGTEIHR